VPEDPDALGLASDFVSGAGETQTVIHLLLSQIVVARDRVSARRLVKDMPPHGRVVTLQGEVFWGNGTAITGQVTSQETSTLSRSRQVRELTEAIAGQEATISRVRQELREVEKQVSTKREEETRLDRQAQEKNSALEKANRACQQAQLKVEQTRRQIDWYQTQKAELETQRIKSENEGQQLKSSIEDTEAKTAAGKDQVRGLIAMLGEVPLEEHQAQAAHWSTTLAVANRAIQDALHRLGELEQMHQSSLAAYERIRSRLDGIQGDLIRLETDKGSTSEVDKGLNDQINLLQGTVEPAEAELSRREKDYEELQTQEEAEQQTLSVAERYHTQALMEYTRQREAVDHLRNRIEEDFGLVVLEYEADVEGPTPLPLEGMVEQLPVVVNIPPDLETNISRLRGQIRRLGAVNPDALTEYESVRERFGFITGQMSDLKKADVDLREVITKLDELMKREFRKTFDLVAVQFRQLFARLFGGGSARLVLTDADQLNEAGIDIEARLPGRREQGLSLLSGGERSLTAVALIFALLKVSPTPFCVLDEVDAMLDEANVGRFRDLLAELSENTQFIIITHNRNTIQAADVIYGVTMGRDSTSQVISLRLEEVSEELVR